MRSKFKIPWYSYYDGIREHWGKNPAKYSWFFEYEFRDELPKTFVERVVFNELVQEEQAKHEKR